MANNTLNTRLVICNDTTANWGTSEKVLLKGEYAIEFPESGEPKVKVGNGTDKYVDLPYITNTPTEITNAINAAVKAASHTHSNKAILDAITASFTTELKANYDKAYTHSQSAHAPSNAQANVIETVKVNGAALTPSNKAVNITIPTYTHPTSGVKAGTYKSVTVDSNGHVTAGTNPSTISGYGITDAYTKAETDSKITAGIAKADHLKRSIVSALPSVSEADEHTIYMVPKASGALGQSDSNGYDEYMLVVSGNTKKFEKIGDSAVDLTNYATKAYADQSEADAVKTAKAYADGLAKNYATSAQGTKADTAVQSVKIGTKEYKSGTTVTLPAYPTTLPASDVPAWAKAKSKPTYTKAEVGLGNVDNTADAAKSVKYATSAGSATSATTASKLGTNAGSTIHPVYFSNGVPVACNVSTDVFSQGSNTLVLDGGSSV